MHWSWITKSKSSLFLKGNLKFMTFWVETCILTALHIDYLRFKTNSKIGNIQEKVSTYLEVESNSNLIKYIHRLILILNREQTSRFDYERMEWHEGRNNNFLLPEVNSHYRRLKTTWINFNLALFQSHFCLSITLFVTLILITCNSFFKA